MTDGDPGTGELGRRLDRVERKIEQVESSISLQLRSIERDNERRHQENLASAQAADQRYREVGEREYRDARERIERNTERIARVETTLRAYAFAISAASGVITIVVNVIIYLLGVHH